MIRIRHRGKTGLFVGALSVALVAAALSAPPAFATSTTEHLDDIAAIVAEASLVAGAPAGDTAAGATANGSVPINPDAPIDVSLPERSTLSVWVPENLQVSNGMTAVGGSTIYQGEGSQPDVSVKPLADGVRVSTVLDESTTERAFEYALSEGVTAELDGDGRVTLSKKVEIDAEGTVAEVTVVVGYVEAAWAIDASGLAVPSHYQITEDSPIQHVETGAETSFPVVADPQWTTTAWNQIRIRWNRAETATIASGGWGATGATAVCIAAGAAIGGPAEGAALGAACLALTGSAVYTAGVAQNSSPKRCLEMFATYTFIVGLGGWVPWFGTYAGGTCK